MTADRRFPRWLGIVLWWTGVYTCGLDEPRRTARLDEIRSDLWEHWVDRAGRGTAAWCIGLEILSRAGRGIPADLLWRLRAGRPSDTAAQPLRRWFDNLRLDVRLALRRLRRAPGFTTAALLTLSVGIGGSTVVYSVVDAVLLERLPYAAPERLTYVWAESRDGVGTLWGSQASALARYARGFDFTHIKGSINVTFVHRDGTAEQVMAQSVSVNHFAVFGVQPALGRFFEPDDEVHLSADEVRNGRDRPPGHLVISHEFWQSRFGGDPAVLGQRFRMQNRVSEIVGVAPRGFRTHLPDRLGIPEVHDVWYLSLWDQSTFDVGLVRPLARLRDGVTLEHAQAELDAFTTWQRQLEPSLRDDEYRLRMVPLHGEVVQAAQRPVWILFGAVSVMLLIACGNITSLMLTRAAARRHEMGVRYALGAARGRLVLEMLVESGLVGLGGAAGGLGLAALAVRQVRAAAPATLPRVETIAVDWTVAGFAVAAGLLAALCFGVIPALRATSAGAGGSTRQIGSADGHRLHAAFAVGQVAMALVLCVGGGLMLRSLTNYLSVDPGYTPTGVLTGTVGAPTAPADERMALYRALQDQIAASPGVRSIGLADPMPLAVTEDRSVRIVATREGALTVPARVRRVTPGFLETLRIPLLAGRMIAWPDLASPDRFAVVVDEPLATRLWGRRDAIGRELQLARLDFSGSDSTVDTEFVDAVVVGVVGPIRGRSLDALDPPTVYAPYHVNPSGDPGLVLRAAGDPLQAVAIVRDALRDLVPGTPFAEIRMLEQDVDRSTAAVRFSLSLIGVFGLLGLCIAAVGTYAVLAYSVARRTREIGLRMALGAGRGATLRRFARLGAGIVGLGVGTGSVIALLANRVLASQLFGVSPWDLSTFGVVATVLSVVVLSAALVPAWRASRLDPVRALRTD